MKKLLARLLQRRRHPKVTDVPPLAAPLRTPDHVHEDAEARLRAVEAQTRVMRRRW